MEGPFQGKGIEDGIGRVFFVGFVVSGLRRWGGTGRVLFYLCVFLGRIVVGAMGFGQCVAGGEERGRVISFSGHCVRVEYVRGTVGLNSVAIRKVVGRRFRNTRRGFSPSTERGAL